MATPESTVCIFVQLESIGRESIHEGLHIKWGAILAGFANILTVKAHSRLEQWQARHEVPDMSPTKAPGISLVTEAFNLAEGQSQDAFVRALQTVENIASEQDNVEVIAVDPTPGNIAASIIADRYPHVRSLHLPGKTYDGQKNAAAHAAQGEFLVFLDGDCVPQRNTWLADLISPFSDPGIHAVGGLTLYEGQDLTSRAMSVLDFGFLFTPDAHGRLGCYASNNVAFRRDSYLALPAPDDGVLRSYCYKHAQLFLRAGRGVLAEHRAFVLHELPDVAKERLRRGYDYVAVLWADPELEETAHLAPTEEFVEHTLTKNLGLALERLKAAPVELGITNDLIDEVETEIHRLMEIDRKGLWQALEYGEASGMNAAARDTHQEYKKSKNKKKKMSTLKSTIS